MANVVVVGAQWGDEGKGKIVDWLSERADVIARFQGGHNAGHTLVIGDKVFKLSLLPSGIVRENKLAVIGNGVVLDPWALFSEIDKLAGQGVAISTANLMIAENTPLILPLHQDLDRLREDAAGASKIGTVFLYFLIACIGMQMDLAALADLKIGVVPVINLEWIQKIHRDSAQRGYSTEAVTDTILRRMHAYVHCICPQFTQTDINFQRVPVVDTSNPFIARWIPTADESLVVIRFRNPRGIDFPYLTQMIDGSWMSRANSIVIPGNKQDLAMQLILTPMILRLTHDAKRA